MRFPFFRNRDSVKNGILISIRRTGDGFHPGLFTIAAFSGDDVYWEVPEDLPKMTKLMIDGKALYIHRANYQIIDKALL